MNELTKTVGIRSNSLDSEAVRYTRTYIIYDFEGRKGLWLSKKERVLCESWLDSNGNYSFAAKIVRKLFNTKTTDMGVRGWLERTHVQEYLQNRLKEKGFTNGYTKDRWLLEAAQYRDGGKTVSSATAKMHELIGKAMGWLGDVTQNFNADKQIIHFTQSNGKE